MIKKRGLFICLLFTLHVVGFARSSVRDQLNLSNNKLKDSKHSTADSKANRQFLLVGVPPVEDSKFLLQIGVGQQEQAANLLINRSQYHSKLLLITIATCLLLLVLLIVVSQNLHRTKKLNLQLADQQVKLETALTALEKKQSDHTDMLKIVAHDLRSPMAGIYALSELMLDEEVVLEDGEEMLKLIKESSRDALKLVNDVLRVQPESEALVKKPVELAELLQRCVSLLRSSADAKGQVINLNLQPITLKASGEKLGRVMNNLVINAIKFSPDKSVIEVTMQKRPGHVRISIADEGIGIPVELENEIFSGAKRVGTAGEESFGLGLAISKQIVEAHEGKIWFERKAGKGTIFLVELPFFED